MTGSHAALPSVDVVVRAARLEDAPTIVDFNHRLALETEKKELDHATLTQGVETFLRDPRLGRYFVATAAARLVGQLAITEEWSDWRNGRIWWLQSVVVDPAWRGRGVFRRLLAHLVALAREQGVIGLRLYMERHNERAQATYLRSGFSDSGYVVLERVPLLPKPAQAE